MNFSDESSLFFGIKSSVETVFISVGLGIVILCTAIGNLFVIYAIITDRILRRVSNYLVLSLATTDLILACTVMPLGVLYAISGKWTFGAKICEIWTSVDVLCCTASLLHLVAIAVDRYWAVTNVEYIRQRNAKIIGKMIAAVWAVAVFTSLAPIFVFSDPNFEKRAEVENVCVASQNVTYQILATILSFYAPLVLILLLYWKIFKVNTN
ncbi:5-hydroxytryptamine receptor-like protein [Dinothrombium tinctorium]|uniref:5-hydroxytryptamine receptor-like protein n=1 Tax=Dinothrombium tinctorium TaxID=1965070 RepID=A0A3S4R462_9ACAR|nr:5-hydroxytryptamine receptor-like protein [Dinothrombium tinctorium]